MFLHAWQETLQGSKGPYNHYPSTTDDTMS